MLNVHNKLVLSKSNFTFKNGKEFIIRSKMQIFSLSAYFFAALISSAISVLINPFLAISLSNEDYALLGYFTSFTSLVLPVVGFSFVTYYARNFFRFDKERRRLMKDTILTSFLVISPIIIMLVLLSYYIYTIYAEVTFPFSPYAFLSFVPVLLGGAYSLYLTDMRMTYNARRFFSVSVFYAIIGASFSIAMVVTFDLGAWGKLMAGLLASAIFCIYSYSRLSYEFRFDKVIFLDAVKFCWPISLSAILYYFLSGIDRAMLERLHDTHNFGLYNVAFQISAYLALFGTAIIQTFDPDILKATSQNNISKLIKITLLIVISTTIPTLLYVFFAEPIISLLTFGRYIEATNLSKILAFRNVTTPFAFVISGIIIGYGYPKIELLNRGIGALLSFFMFKYLIKYYGFEGAAWGQVFSMLFMSIISMLFIVYKSKIRLYKIIR